MSSISSCSLPRRVLVSMAVLSLTATACSNAAPSATENPVVDPVEDVDATEQSEQEVTGRNSSTPSSTVPEIPEDWSPFATPDEDDVETVEDPNQDLGEEPGEQAFADDEVTIALAASAEAMARAETYLFTSYGYYRGGDELVTVTTQGAVDGKKRAAQSLSDGLIETWGSDDPSIVAQLEKQLLRPTTSITDGENEFLKSAPITEPLGFGESWVIMPTDVPLESPAADPRFVVAGLSAPGGDVARGATEMIAGVETVAYEGTFDPSGTFPLAPPFQATLWISNDGLVHRVQADIVLAGYPHELEMMLTGFGEPVSFEIPSIDEALPHTEVFGS